MNKNSEKVIRYRIRLKLKLIEYKGGKCEKCGYNKPIPGVYHFHHLRDKQFIISGSTLGFERLKDEVDKCLLLCANCHAETHDKDWNEQRQLTLSKVRHTYVKESICCFCNKDYTKKRNEQKYCCRKCQFESMKK